MNYVVNENGAGISKWRRWIELFFNGEAVVDVYGYANVDGTGEHGNI